MLNYNQLDENDKRIQKIIKGLDEVLAKSTTIVIPSHVDCFGMGECDEYMICNNGTTVCRVAGEGLWFGNDKYHIMLPNKIATDLNAKLKKRAVKGDIEYVLLLQRLKHFSR